MRSPQPIVSRPCNDTDGFLGQRAFAYDTIGPAPYFQKYLRIDLDFAILLTHMFDYGT